MFHFRTVCRGGAGNDESGFPVPERKDPSKGQGGNSLKAAFTTLKHDSLRERIAEEIKKAILDGTLREGERIVERNLAAQFSTSLTSVREALIELDAKGFVIRKPNSATHVVKFSGEAASQVFAFRRVVETHTIEEAARTATPGQLELVNAAYKELMEVALVNDARQYLQKDLALHEAIWRASNNEYFEIALKRVVRPFFGFTVIRVDVAQTFDLAQDAILHFGFVKPIQTHDVPAAREGYLRALDEWYSQTYAYILSKERIE